MIEQKMSVCRVCGKKYPRCYSKPVTGVFQWRSVACSPECAKKYLAEPSSYSGAEAALSDAADEAKTLAKKAAAKRIAKLSEKKETETESETADEAKTESE